MPNTKDSATAAPVETLVQRSRFAAGVMVVGVWECGTVSRVDRCVCVAELFRKFPSSLREDKAMDHERTWHDSMLADLDAVGRAARQLSRLYSGRSPAGLSVHQVKEYLRWLRWPRGEKQAAAGWR